jgi:enoyl-CoA hydratase
MIQGYCIGGGLGVALCCDLRFAAANSRFAIPAARLGLGYAYGGIKQLVDVVGPSFAKEIFYTARQFSADEAVSMGLINRTYSAADLLTAVNDASTRIGQKSSGSSTFDPATIDQAKRMLASAVLGWLKK